MRIRSIKNPEAGFVDVDKKKAAKKAKLEDVVQELLKRVDELEKEVRGTQDV